MSYQGDIYERSIADAVNVPTGTYYPDAAGEKLDVFHHVSLTGQLIDGAAETTTLTVEATNDEDGVNWVQIYGYDSRVHAWVNQQTITNGTLDFAWDFDYLNYKFIRCLITTTAATNTVIIKSRGRN